MVDESLSLETFFRNKERLHQFICDMFDFMDEEEGKLVRFALLDEDKVLEMYKFLYPPNSTLITVIEGNEGTNCTVASFLTKLTDFLLYDFNWYVGFYENYYLVDDYVLTKDGEKLVDGELYHKCKSLVEKYIEENGDYFVVDDVCECVHQEV